MSKIFVEIKGSDKVGYLKDWLVAPKVKRRGTQLEFEGVYRADGVNAHLLYKGNIIHSDADARNKEQQFDIIRTVFVDDTRIEVYGVHVAHRLKYLSLLPNVTAEGPGYHLLRTWLDSIVGRNKFNMWSDITETAKIEWSLDKISNAREALYGHELSLATVLKADVGFDNYEIKLSKNLGKRSNVVLSYGKNITEFRQEDNDEDVFTSVYPYMIHEKKVYTLDENERVVDSPYADNYLFSRVLPVDFTSEFKEDEFDGGDAGENEAEGIGEGEVEEKDTATGGVWKRNSTGWWYEFSNGKYLKNCWKFIDNEWYRFKKSGYIYQNAWFRDKHGNRYYFKDSGAMVTGWYKVKKKWKYFLWWGGLDKDRKKPYELDKAKLKQLAEKYIRDHNIGFPKVNVTVSFVDLMAENPNFNGDIAIYDDVKIKFPKLNNAVSKARVIGTVWLPLSDTYESITVGNEESTLTQSITSRVENKLSKVEAQLAEQASAIKENEKLLFSESDGETNVTYTADTLDEESPLGFQKDDLLLKDNKLQRWTGKEWKDVETKSDVDVSHIAMGMTDLKTQMKVLKQEQDAKASLSVVSELKRAYDAYVDKETKDKAKAESDLIEMWKRVEQIKHDLGNMAVTYKFIDQNVRLANEGISVGNPYGDCYLLIANNRMSMFSAGQEVMYVSQGMLHIDNGVFTKTLQIGNYIESPLESNPNINVVRFVGRR